MIKNTRTILLIIAFTTFISCKKSDENATKIDANNMIVPSEILEVNRVTEANNIKKIQNYPILEFLEKEFDFGTITDGDIVEHTYKLVNAGKSDLLIIDAKATCGCTVPDWTKTPIKPGETGQIKIVFNSGGKTGKQQKYINLVTNTEAANESISFKAQVNSK